MSQVPIDISDERSKNFCVAKMPNNGITHLTTSFLHLSTDSYKMTFLC